MPYLELFITLNLDFSKNVKIKFSAQMFHSNDLFD